MFLRSEKMQREMHEFIESKSPQNEEELKAVIEEFIEMYNAQLDMEDDVDLNSPEYLLEKAYNTEDPNEAARLAKRVLKMQPDNIDAKIELIMTYPNEKRIKELEKLTKEIREDFKKFDIEEDEGEIDYYFVLEARPFLRLLTTYMNVLESYGKIRKAIEIGEEIQRLNPNDNMGTRYELIKYYTMIEDLDKAESLYRRFIEDDSIQMLFTIAMLYYKLDDLINAKRFIKKAYHSNNNLKDLLNGSLDLEDESEFDLVEEGQYIQGEISEIVNFMAANHNLMGSNIMFIGWAGEELERYTKKPKKKKRK